MNHLMNNLLMFGLFKKQLTDKGINTTPPGLLLGLMPGMNIPMAPKFFLNKAVIDGEIAVSEKNEAATGKAVAEQKLVEIKKIVANLNEKDSAEELKKNILNLKVAVGLHSPKEVKEAINK